MLLATPPPTVATCLARWNAPANAAMRSELIQLDKKPAVYGTLDHVRIKVSGTGCSYEIYGRFGDASFLLRPGEAPFWYTGLSTAPLKDSPLGRYGPGNARRVAGGRFALHR
jgi:hypothetical protein